MRQEAHQPPAVLQRGQYTAAALHLRITQLRLGLHGERQEWHRAEGKEACTLRQLASCSQTNSLCSTTLDVSSHLPLHCAKLATCC